MRLVGRPVILLLLILLFPGAGAFAGTGQIFSPAGLPQSSTQSYTPPTPDNTPTVSFPTPPLPLGGSILQGMPGSILPLSNNSSTSTTTTPTQGDSSQLSIRPSQNTGHIESFFQCSPAPQNTKQPTQKKTVVKSAGKLIWHTLDNLGVPMFVGKDNDLDPSLRQGYVAPLPKIPTQTTVPITPQKIPESELEGTDVSQKNDQQIQLH